MIGAGGKMGMRVSNNLQRTGHTVYYSENSPAGQERNAARVGRSPTPTPPSRAPTSRSSPCRTDPGRGLRRRRAKVPSGSIILTLDPAAAYAGLLAERDDIYFAVAHPCHPSVFFERTTKEQWADTFGGIAAPQEVVAALETGGDEQKTVRRER